MANTGGPQGSAFSLSCIEPSGKAVAGASRACAALTLVLFSTFMCFLLIRKPVNENLAIWSKSMSS